MSFAEAVEAAQQMMADHELVLAALSAPVDIRDLFPGTFGYRLRQRRWAPQGPPEPRTPPGWVGG